LAVVAVLLVSDVIFTLGTAIRLSLVITMPENCITESKRCENVAVLSSRHMMKEMVRILR
jgi:hypothetical protein